MHDDIGTYFETLAAARQAVRNRLALACCVSLVAHAGFLSLPSGGPGRTQAQHASNPSRGTSQLAGNTPAPLVVSLATYQLAPAVTDRTGAAPHQPIARPPRQTSPAVADNGQGAGGPAAAVAPREAGTLDGPGLPLPNYFDATEVSTRASALDEIDFDLPELGQIGGSGKTILTLYVNEAGRIDKVDIESTGGVDSALVNGVARQFGKANFQPATIDDVAVKSRMRVEILLRPLLQR